MGLSKAKRSEEHKSKCESEAAAENEWKWSVLTNPNNLSKIYGIKIRIIVEEEGQGPRSMVHWSIGGPGKCFFVLCRPVILFPPKPTQRPTI